MISFAIIFAVYNICMTSAFDQLQSKEPHIKLSSSTVQRTITVNDNESVYVSNRSVIKIEFERIYITRGKAIRELTLMVSANLSGRSTNNRRQRVKCDDSDLRNHPNMITKSLAKAMDVNFIFFESDIRMPCTVDFDIHKPEGNQSKDNFILKTTLYIAGNKMESNITHSISSILSISYSGTKCDFDTDCFLQFNKNVKVVQIGEPNLELCEELPEQWNTLTGYFGFLSDGNKRRFYSNIVTGSTFGSFLELSIWQGELDYQMLVAVILKDRSRIISDSRGFLKLYQQEWRNEIIKIDRIDEAFYIVLQFDLGCSIIVDNITLHINNKEGSSKAECSESEFVCMSGQCIDQNKTCNMIQDCFDGDDESKEIGCDENDNMTSCDFETSLCGWTIDESTSKCSWKIKDSNQIRLQDNFFKLQQRGNVLYLNGSDCVESTVTVTSSKFKHSVIQNKTCRMHFSYILSNTFLDVLVCTDDVCTKKRTYRVEKKWVTENFLIPLVNKRIQIQFGGRIYNKILQHKYIAIDAVSIDESCFSTYESLEDTMTAIETDSITANIVIVSLILVCTITIGIVILVIRRRQSGIRSKFSVHKLSTDHILYGETSTYSSIYSPMEVISVEEYINSIPKQRITIQRLIAKGNFGEVYYGLLSDVDHQKQNIPVAIKTLPRLYSEQTKSDFFVEGVTLSKLRHSNIVRLLGISLEASSMFLICEMMNGGDLRTHVRQIRGEIDDMTTKTLVNYVIDVASGCQYLEENGCIHRDLAARNCLLNEECGHMVVKVADFGMSRFMGRTNYYRKTGAAPMPVKWMPPEAFLEGMFTSKTDVWSFGILLWEVFTLGCVPYPGKSHEEVMEFVKNGGTPCRPDLCTPDIYELMFGCWNLSPEDRPNFITLKSRLLSIKERGGHINFIQN